ncbi:MAG: exported protein of unknown function, partial [Verrucomicrobiales bacterium]|nr:exported protein of unknown function [Verrucomicrobiales bacterium]
KAFPSYPIEIDNVRVAEGNTGTTNAVFHIRLLQVFGEVVSLNYYTMDATAIADMDYASAAGSIEFPPGITDQTVSVSIIGNYLGEADKVFYLVVEDLTSSLSFAYGTCTILDDEPSISISDAKVAEPSIGTNYASFSIKLSRPSDVSVSVEYFTAGGSAQPNLDFIPITGTVAFAPGQTNQTINIPIVAHRHLASVEIFSLILTNPLNSTVAVSNATGFILNTPRLSRSSFGTVIEPMGPCSRMTDLVISEIMYHPLDYFRGTSGKDLDFIELYNAGQFPEDIGGYRLTGDVSIEFPTGTIIQPGAFLVIADKPSAFFTAYGLSGVFNFAGGLPAPSGTVRLRNRSGAVLLEVNYNNQPPWPPLADGKGYSLVLARPSLGESDPRAWDISEQVGGSPGMAEPSPNDPLHNIVINELLANSVLPDFDFIELYNKSSQDVNISECTLSDSPDVNKFVFVGAVIPAGSYLALDDLSLGFKLKAQGDTVYFRGPDGHILDAVHYDAQRAGVSLGRFPEGGADFFPLFPPTPFDRNDSLFSGDVVINEIMYAPPSGDSREAYIELHNRTTNSVNLGGWKFTDGIDFAFPEGKLIPPQGYLVIGHDVSYLLSRYDQLNSGNAVGNYSGTLAGKGERIVLARPETLNIEGLTNIILVSEDQVTYDLDGPWGQWSKGGGSSLELGDPGSENRFAENWQDSDEGAKSTWVTIEAVSSLTNAPDGGGTDLQLMLLGAGECLVNDVQVLQANGSSLLPNGSFEAGLYGWLPGGNHVRTSLDDQEFKPGLYPLHLRASGSGDTTLNNVRAHISSPLPSGQITLRAKARWLRGNPILVLRLAGRSVEASVSLPIPANLGTPGLANSRKVLNSGPVITDVRLNPVLPVAGQPLTIAARIQDPDGLSTVSLFYRLDPGNDTVQLAMLDDGTHGDAMAGDGIYTVTLPAQGQGTLVAFFIQAWDAHSLPVSSRFPTAAPARECLVRFGEEPFSGNFGGINIWISSSNLAVWNTRPLFSNEPIDCTVVYGNVRTIFNAGIRFGSDALGRTNLVSATNGLCSYSIILPPGEKLLGSDRWDLEPIDVQTDPSLLRRKIVQWMAAQLNLPYGFERFMHFTLNGIKDSDRGVPIFLDRRIPDEEFINAWFPDSPNGELFEIMSQLELVAGSNSIQVAHDATLTDLNSSDLPRQARACRWNWRPFHGWGEEVDFLHLFGLADALNAPDQAFENFVEGALDVDQWTLSLAFRRCMGDENGYGYPAGRNAFICKPPGRKWQMIPAAVPNPFGAGKTNSPTEEVLNCNPSEIDRLLHQPSFTRKYLRSLHTIASQAMDVNRVQNEVLEFGSQLMEANGLSSDFDGRATLLAWIAERNNYLTSLQPPPDFYLESPSSIITDNELITIHGVGGLEITDITFGPLHAQVSWVSPTNWTAQLLVPPGTNFYVGPIAVLSDGSAISAAGFSVSNSAIMKPLSRTLAITEIFYAPTNSHGGYIELYNPGETAFDASAISLPGFGLVFPSSFLVPSHAYLIIPEDQSAFTRSYGVNVRIVGELGRPLNSAGETLTLVSSSGNELSKVKFETAAPWPVLSGRGHSLQLIDPNADVSRVGNWSSGPPTPGQGAFNLRPAFPMVWINELQNRNTGAILDNANESDPWIELYNSSTNSIALGSTFYLTDNYSNLSKWAFAPGILIAPLSFLLVWADGQIQQNAAAYPHTNFRLSQNSGTVALVQGDGENLRIVDYINFSGLPPGRSFGSYPNGQLFQRELLAAPTPRAPNQPPPIFINEWMASNGGIALDPADGHPDDWFELYNASSEPRNLRGYKLSDRKSFAVPFIIPYDRIIPPHGYLLVWADGETFQNKTNATDLHTPWNLSAKGETIFLFAPDGIIMDNITFGQQSNNISQGRFPDGGGSFFNLSLPTAGSSNRLVSLKAPVLAPIPNRVVTVGQLLTFPVQASDVDTPPSLLNFRLGPGTPSGAAMEGANFAWNPVASQAPSTNLILVQVSDNSTPPLIGSQTFQVIVALPPQPKFAASGPGDASLSFDAWPGMAYQLWYKDQLQDSAWIPMTVISNNSSKVVVPFNPATNSQRFFRVGVLN